MALREKASKLESDLARETDLRTGAEKLANEVQSSLTKESERAEDLKVMKKISLNAAIRSTDPILTYADSTISHAGIAFVCRGVVAGGEGRQFCDAAEGGGDDDREREAEVRGV